MRKNIGKENEKEMILYHYSVDSFKGGDHLINDYKDQYRYAEPFILALRQGMNIFTATYFATMYAGRELVSLNLRKYENFHKDALEAIFEYVREKEFKDMPSRLKCVYYCRSKEEALAYMKDDCFADDLFTKEQVRLLEVEVEDGSIREYDQAFYNLSLGAMENNDFDSVFTYARRYYSMELSDNPIIEIVSNGKNMVLKEISY